MWLQETVHRLRSCRDTVHRYFCEMLEQVRVKFTTYQADLPLSIYQLILSSSKQRKGETTQQRLNIAVCGTINAGKTSIINALIGFRILPTSSARDTIVPTELYHSFQPEISLYFKEPFGQDKLRKLMRSLRWENNRLRGFVNGDSSICFCIDSPTLNVLRQCVMVVDETLRAHAKWVKLHIDRMVIGCPFHELVRHVRFVDLPGTGGTRHADDDIFRKFDTAQHMLHVLDAERIDGKDVACILDACRNRGKKVTLVLNKADLLPSADREAAARFMSEHIKQPYICCSAALYEFALQMKYEGINLADYLKTQLRVNLSELILSNQWNVRNQELNKYLTRIYVMDKSGIGSLRQLLGAIQ